MSTEQNLKFPEVLCTDFTAPSTGKTYKGCGEVVVMQKTGEKKQDGKPKWAKFNRDGSPHNHDANRQGTTRLDDVRAPVSNPDAKSTPDGRLVALQIQLDAATAGYADLLRRVEKLENQLDVSSKVNASEDELGEDKVE